MRFTIEKSFKCLKCGTVTVRKAQLRTHLQLRIPRHDETAQDVIDEYFKGNDTDRGCCDTCHKHPPSRR